jgi:HK97 family phage portal protein
MQPISISMDFQKILKSFKDTLGSKSYVGVMPGALPVASKNWNQNDFLTALEVSLYTNKAIAKRAEKVSEVEFVLTDARGKEIDNDPILDLLYRPNEIFTGRQFWKLYQTYLDTIGEVYIYLESDKEIFKGKNIKAMHLLIPTLVTPHFDEYGKPSKYEYKTENKTITYQPDQIIYVHNPNPKSPLRGQSLLKAGVPAITTETQISLYHSRVIENGGKVEGVFKFKTPKITKDQLTELKDQYQKEYGAAKKAGLPLFLGGDAEYIKTGLTPDELSFLEAKKMSLEDICILTGVPKSMLASTNDVKYDNADADRMIFLHDTIHPLLVTLTTVLDEKLFPDGKTLSFVDPTPENIDRKLKEIENGIKNYYMTINEARERHGLDPVSDGDTIKVPFNLIDLSATKTGDSTKTVAKGVSDHPLKDYDMRRLYWDIQIKRMDNREKVFKKTLNTYFDEQEQRLVDMLQPTKTRVFRKKELLDELIQLELEVKIGKDMFLPVLRQMLEDAGIQAMEFVGSDGAFNLTADIASWLEKKTDVFLTKINETTFETLKSQFQESLAAEEGRDALVKRVQETYGDVKKTRAKTIARTEVHNATQYGTMKGYEQAGLQIKIWVAVMDDATRESHQMVDGEEVPINMAFSNGLMYPGDPNGPAEEVINCRCVI